LLLSLYMHISFIHLTILDNRRYIDVTSPGRVASRISEALHVAYIDIKAAFDSVDHQALWKALHATGAPQFLIQLIQDLHTGTMSRVRVGKRLSKAFYTSSGVRQGCVLAPALFCLAIAWIMSRCSSSLGITLDGAVFTDLDYADDAVLFAEDQGRWQAELKRFDDTANTMGLHTSWEKI